MIRNLQVDTYERELERYGPRLITDVEDLFHRGSELAAFHLQQFTAEMAVPGRFQFGLLTAERMTRAFFSGNEEEMLDFIRMVTAGFLLEVKADKKFRAELDKKYRLLTPQITATLRSVEHSELLKPVLLHVESLAKLTGDYDQAERITLLADAVHMQLNRNFKVQHRQQELLVYFCLEKYLISIMARRK